MRGRRPLPTSVKIRNGNPGHYPLNRQEIQHDAMDTAMPPELVDPLAQEEWTRVASVLSARGQVTVVDRSTLVGYCLKYGQWRQLEAKCVQHGFLAKNGVGAPVASPFVKMANAAFALVLRSAAELGLTPSSRSRVQASELPAEDEFSLFQRARTPLKRVK